MQYLYPITPLPNHVVVIDQLIPPSQLSVSSHNMSEEFLRCGDFLRISPNWQRRDKRKEDDRAKHRVIQVHKSLQRSSKTRTEA